MLYVHIYLLHNTHNLLTLSLIHESDKARQPKDKTEDKTDGDRNMRDSGEASMGALLQRIIDQICVVVTNKG